MAAKGMKRKTHKAKEKIPGTPRRPLSAYNIFFKVQRYLIINGETDAISTETINEIANAPNSYGDKKRIHRKTHGKISFADLAKEISHRWKEASGSKIASHFYSLAKIDRKRYDEENLVFQMKQSATARILQQKCVPPKIVDLSNEAPPQPLKIVVSEMSKRKKNCIEPLPLASHGVEFTLDEDTCKYVLSVLNGGK